MGGKSLFDMKDFCQTIWSSCQSLYNTTQNWQSPAMPPLSQWLLWQLWTISLSSFTFSKAQSKIKDFLGIRLHFSYTQMNKAKVHSSRWFIYYDILLALFSSMVELNKAFIPFPKELLSRQWPNPDMLIFSMVVASCAFGPCPEIYQNIRLLWNINGRAKNMYKRDYKESKNLIK